MLKRAGVEMKIMEMLELLSNGKTIKLYLDAFSGAAINTF